MSTAEAETVHAPPPPEATLQLAGDLGIEQVGALQAQLRDSFESERVTVEAAAVTRVHCAAMQLLAAFCRDRRAAGRYTHWRTPSATLRDAMDRLGLAPQLQIEEI